MIEMQYETHQPHSELFLVAEDVGYLLLTASGESYRKWQGLCVDELCVFADFGWHLQHETMGANFSQAKNERTWNKTTRSSDAIHRHWSLSCGCDVVETWSWPALSQSLEVRWQWSAQGACKKNAKKTQLRVTPRWTLCHAGSPHRGGGQTQLILDPQKPDRIEICSEWTSTKINVLGLSLDDNNRSAWTTLDETEHLDVPTPKDFERGENDSRSVFSTHTSKITLEHEKLASLCIEFHGAIQKQSKTKNESEQLSQFISNDTSEDWQNATANAQHSLNQLVRKRTDGELGLQAGLPWFTQFWTRDLCHSFRAAFLWSGRTKDGEQIIARLWEKSVSDVPNYTTSTATTNNSADASPLLLLSTADLIDVIGLTDTLKQQLPRITAHLKRGAQSFKRGELLKHGPADTWMDAQKTSPTGELIACSPRADRAVEIQLFWIAALQRWAHLLVLSTGSDEAEFFASAARDGIKLVRENFYNPEKKRWADHLRPDGSQDLSLRPNLLLGLSALQRAGLLNQLMTDSELRFAVNEMIETDLIVSYGVRTLSPDTPAKHPRAINDIFDEQSAYIHENKIHFHPYHEFGSRRGLEHPDWAYHNGTIWPWLSHSTAQILLQTGHSTQAHQLTETLVWHALHGNQGGAITELLDGLSSQSHWSWAKGAPHQAWSEAALIHLMIEEWIGLRVQNSGKMISINPKNWNQLGHFTFHFRHSCGTIKLQYTGTHCFIELNQAASDNSQIEIQFSHTSKTKTEKLSYLLTPHSPARVNLT